MGRGFFYVETKYQEKYRFESRENGGKESWDNLEKLKRWDGILSKERSLGHRERMRKELKKIVWNNLEEFCSQWDKKKKKKNIIERISKENREKIEKKKIVK